MNWKKIGVFVVLLLLIMLLANLLFRMIIPIKPVMIDSENMEPAYSKYDVLFYHVEADYHVGDAIFLKDSLIGLFVTRIISENPDGTFEAKADNNFAQFESEKGVQKEDIFGRIVYSISPYIFYLLLWGIEILVAFLLTQPVYSGIQNE